MPRAGTGRTITVRAYPTEHARILVRLAELQAERPSVLIPDVIREMADKAGLPLAPDPLPERPTRRYRRRKR